MSANPAAAEAAQDAGEAAAGAQTEPEDVTEELPEEGGTPADGGEAPATEGEPAAEQEAAAAAGDKKAEIPEAELQKAALKYANKTMAAARRAEARAEAAKTENATLKTSVKVYEDFVTELQTSPFTALRKIGVKSIKEWLNKGIEAGGEPREPTAEEQIAELKRERQAEKDEAAKATRAAKVEEAKRNVFDALGKEGDRFVRVLTPTGRSRVWAAIEKYHEMHGSCPDEAVYLLADAAEKGLREEFGDPVPRPTPGRDKTGAPAVAAAPAGRSSGKTLTNKQTAGAPATREYSLDPEERRKQVTEDMRAAGEL